MKGVDKVRFGLDLLVECVDLVGVLIDELIFGMQLVILLFEELIVSVFSIGEDTSYLLQLLLEKVEI